MRDPEVGPSEGASQVAWVDNKGSRVDEETLKVVFGEMEVGGIVTGDNGIQLLTTKLRCILLICQPQFLLS